MWTLAKRQILLVLAGSGRQYRLSWIGYVVACDTNSHLRMPIIYRDLHKTELHTWEDIHSSKSTWPTHHRPAFVEHRPNQMKKTQLALSPTSIARHISCSCQNTHCCGYRLSYRRSMGHLTNLHRLAEKECEKQHPMPSLSLLIVIPLPCYHDSIIRTKQKQQQRPE